MEARGGAKGVGPAPKYCLLAYRATPHAATLFSPYELVHGRQLRGPLQALKEGWTQGEITFKTSIEWVNQLRDTFRESSI